MTTILTHTNLDECIDAVAAGKGTIYLPTYGRVTVYDTKTVKRWQKAGNWLIKPAQSPMGDAFRVARGKNSDFVFPGYLRYVSHEE